MKKTNKGFSLVELIIVIAIMAILAGALAPALIKYINKSRLSTDVQTASAIATACQAAISSEQGYDAAMSNYSGQSRALSAYTYTQSDACSNVIKETCGTDAPVPKAKKCLGKDSAGTACKISGYGGEFTLEIDPDANSITIKSGGHTLYPKADGCITG